MQDDAELLRCYAETHSESAFAELVQRHLNFVFAAALRLVAGDTHLAQDVAQTVFTDLARKSGSLANRPVLTGWLYTSARFASAKAVRTARRRQTREQEAHFMQELMTDTVTDADWERLRPVIDDALQALNEREREAVLLRFFEGRPFPEIGLKLSLSADAARLRVERALEKMRTVLTRRGVNSTTSALALALANQPVVAAPAELAVAVTGAALAGAAAGSGGLAANFMSMTTLQIGLAGAIIAGGGAGFMAQAKTNDGLRAEIATLREQQAAVARLRDENRALANVAAEVASLRVDGTELARLREEVAAARRQTQAKSLARAEPSPASLPPLRSPDERLQRLQLPDADIETALQTLALLTGWRLQREGALGHGIVDVRAGAITKAEAVELLRAALRDRAGITLEPGPNGTVLVKRATGR